MNGYIVLKFVVRGVVCVLRCVCWKMRLKL